MQIKNVYHHAYEILFELSNIIIINQDIIYKNLHGTMNMNGFQASCGTHKVFSFVFSFGIFEINK